MLERAANRISLNSERSGPIHTGMRHTLPAAPASPAGGASPRRLIWVLVAATALFGWAGTGARAAIVTPSGGHTIGIVARAKLAGLSSTSPLTASPRSAAAPSGVAAAGSASPAQGIPAGYETVINQFLTDVGADSGKSTNAYAVTAQYGAASTPTTSGAYHQSFAAGANAFVDGTAFPSGGCAVVSPYTTCVTDQQVQQELANVMAAHPSWPTDTRTSLPALYAIFLPPGVDECSGTSCADADFCAYHSYATSGTIYAVLPYPTDGCGTGSNFTVAGSESPNGTPAADAEISLLSHEDSESITDPYLNAWFTRTYDDEIGDLCAYVFGAPSGGAPGAQYNQTINSDHYYIQDEYADVQSAGTVFDSCQQSPGAANDGIASSALIGNDTGPLVYHRGGAVMSAPTVYAIYWSPGIIASFTAPAGLAPGQTANLDASASSDPANEPLSYSWSFGDGQVAGPSSSATISHAFPNAGTYTVALTVADTGGLAATASRTIVVGGPTASFTVTPTQPIAGQAVTLTSTSTDAAAAITQTQWSIDGAAPVSGAPTLTKTFASAGSHTVSLTVTDADGATSTTAGTVDVLAPSASPAPAGTQTTVTPPSGSTAGATGVSGGLSTAPSATTAGVNPAVSTVASAYFQFFSGPRVVRDHGRYLLQTGQYLSCHSATACSVTITVVTRTAAITRNGRRIAGRTITLASGRMIVPAFGRLQVRLHLSSSGASVLRNLRRLRATLSLRAGAAGLSLAVETLAVRLSAPAAPRG